MEKRMLARYPIGNPRRKWRQDNFILSIVNPGPMGLDCHSERHRELARRSVETAVAAGFDWMELLWASPEVGTEILRTAERLSSRVLYQDLCRFGGMGWTDRKLNESNDLLGAMRDTACWRSIIGYSLYDEPVTPEQRATARKMMLEAEAERPDLLPFTVADSSKIAEVAREIDPAQLSFDYYPFGVAAQELRREDQLDRSELWYFFEIARREAAAIGAPFWFYYQGHELHYRPYTSHYTFAASRAMAGGALLYGAKQLAAYIEFDGVLDPESGGRGVFFEEQRALNRELAALGNTLMALECRRVLHDASLAPEREGWDALAASSEESELLTGPLPYRTSVSELRDAYGHSYLMILNRDIREAHHIRLSLRRPFRLFRIRTEDGLEHLADESTKSLTVSLGPGGFALYRLQPTEEEAYTVEYYLDKCRKNQE